VQFEFAVIAPLLSNVGLVLHRERTAGLTGRTAAEEE
jgi:hypothetical protein